MEIINLLDFTDRNELRNWLKQSETVLGCHFTF